MTTRKKGCECPIHGVGQGCACRAARFNLPYASDDWCGCECHDPPSLGTLRGLVKEFEAFRAKHKHKGAQDTEPDAVFQQLLVRAFKGKRPTVPSTPRGWELYSEARGVEGAARDLASKAQACIDHIGGIALSEAGPVESFLRAYCWRIDW